jgi:hypothetical protein
MRKLITALFFLTMLSHNALSIDFSMSAGGGGLLGYTFTRYTMEGGGAKSTQSMNRFDYGGFAFFDATYVEFSVLFQSGKNNWEETTSLNSAALPSGSGTGTSTYLGFSLLGKYPFTINEKMKWYPLMGVEYQISLAERRKSEGYSSEYNRTKSVNAADRDKDGNNYPLSAWNSFWIDVGAGLDYAIFGPLFLRADLLFGFRLPTTYEMGALEVVKQTFETDDPKLKGLTGSPTLKIAAGYRF